MMEKDMGAISGSREPDQTSSSGPERKFNPYELKWIAATPLQQPAVGEWICKRSGISSPASFAWFVRKNPDLFERHWSPHTPCWLYRLSKRGAAIATEAEAKDRNDG